MGRVDDLTPLDDRAALVISPLRTALPPKIKLIEALDRGNAPRSVVVVTTIVTDILGSALILGNNRRGVRARAIGRRTTSCPGYYADVVAHFPRGCEHQAL